MARGFLAILLLFVAGFGLADDKQSLDSVRAMKLAAPKKWAVVIGASDYRELGSLKYARNDAVEFAHALTEDFTFRPEDVTLLIDKDRPEAAPTAKNVLASLDRIFADKRLDKGDLFIFYFSGHGVGTKAGDFLCPTDTTRSTIEKVGLPVREVIKRIVGAGLKNVLILCDACRAGEQNPFGGELQELAGKANLAVLLGCAPGKRSYEYAELSHGAFTHFLLQGMRDPALRDSVSGAVWASRLAEFVKKQVYDYTEPDHGKFAQQPASWNEQTQDVLLASFAPRIEAVQQAMADLAGSKRINNAVYGTALYSIAELLATKRLTGPAIELLKTIDQLGEMTPRRKMTLAGLLLEAHRYSEAARFCDQVIGEDRGYYRDQAMLISPSPAITAAQRAKAAEAIWSEDRDFASGLTALTSATSPDDRRRLLGRLVRTFPEGNAEGLYLQALAAREAHDRVKELDRLWASTKAKGEDLAIHAALEDLMLLYQAAKDIAGELKVISAAIDTGKDKLMWLGQLASVYRELKQPDKMIASIHRGLRSGETMDPL
ncbi:MAG TPA: caspase family protein, partial [Fimbriimonadaceae bacterium]|nr:caspase family protein [Fimbriimonadaceae bacterium]